MASTTSTGNAGGSSMHTHGGGPSVFGQLLVLLLLAPQQTLKLNKKSNWRRAIWRAGVDREWEGSGKVMDMGEDERRKTGREEEEAEATSASQCFYFKNNISEMIFSQKGSWAQIQYKMFVYANVPKKITIHTEHVHVGRNRKQIVVEEKKWCKVRPEIFLFGPIMSWNLKTDHKGPKCVYFFFHVELSICKSRLKDVSLICFLVEKGHLIWQWQIRSTCDPLWPIRQSQRAAASLFPEVSISTQTGSQQIKKM